MSSQDNRFASVTTPLGEDILLFSQMTGSEEMSRLFEYEVDLVAENKNVNNVVATKLLGQAMVVTLVLPSGNKRYFHGLVTQFRQCGVLDDFSHYRALLRPWLWFLTRTSNCRIFQEKSVPDIIKEIFKNNGFSDANFELTKSYKPRTYCVQYRETDFNFVSRLMECEGLFYFFKHEHNKHILSIGDSVSAYETIANYSTIPYFPPENISRRKQDHIFDWQVSHKVQSGNYTLNDYDFEKPKSNLISKFKQEKPHAHAAGEQYDYPGNYIEASLGDSYANIRLDELQIDYEVIQGSGNALGLTTGMLFTLKDHHIATENTKHILTAAHFLITSNQYRSSSATETHYQCNFSAIRATQQFRPSRLTPVPFVQGPQTATVVGKSSEEIWTDKYGRIKVQFHWDRNGKSDEKSSCWVRVATPIAGKQWGWVSLPRIGQEVVVSFLEGNPDQPLITGSVYNTDQMPPYTLPANQTQSGLKTRSSKGGTEDNFNELRFEDKKGKEEVYFHAEKDFNCVIENNETRKIGLDKKDKGNQTTDIQNDRTTTLKMGNDSLKIEQGNCSTKVSLGNYVLDVDAGKATITAMTSIELKVGGNSIKLEQSGITIKGVMVKIQADATLDAKSPMTTVNGDGMLTLKGGLTMIN